MELFSFNIKKKKKKNFLKGKLLYISRNGTLHFSAGDQKIKNNSLEKVSHTSRNENL